MIRKYHRVSRCKLASFSFIWSLFILFISPFILDNFLYAGSSYGPLWPCGCGPGLLPFTAITATHAAQHRQSQACNSCIRVRKIFIWILSQLLACLQDCISIEDRPTMNRIKRQASFTPATLILNRWPWYINIYNNIIRVIFYKRVPYSQRYIFTVNPDINHNANPTNPNGNSKQ